MAFMERISVIIDAKVDGFTAGFKKMRADIAEAEGLTGKFKAGWSGMVSGVKANAGALAAGAGASLLAFGDDILEAGLALEQMDAKAEAVFGGSVGMVREWAAENAAAMGLTERAAVGAAAGIADLLKPMGFTTEAAAQQAVAITDLSGALAAWSAGKYDAAQVSEILSKAMLGEREQLKSLGISITEADVQARLAAQGQDKLTGSALAQAKALATQQLITEKSTDAQKAWNDGSMDGVKAANESKASFAEMTDTLMEALYPALEGVVPLAAEAAAGLAPLIKAVADFAAMTKRAFGTDPMRDSFIAGEDAVEKYGEAFLRTNLARQKGIDSAGEMEKALFYEKISVEEVVAAIEELETADAKAAEEARLAAEARGAASRAYYEHVAAVDAATDALPNFTEEERRAARLAREAKKDIDKLNDALQEINDDNAALDIADQFDDLAAAATDAYVATAEGSAEAEQAQRDYQREINNTKQAVADYATEVLKLPPDRVTNLLAQIDKGNMDYVEGELARLARQRGVSYIPVMYGGGAGGTGANGTGASGDTGNISQNAGPNMIQSAGAGRGGGGGAVFNINVYSGGEHIGRDIAEALTRWWNDGGRAQWMGGG